MKKNIFLKLLLVIFAVSFILNFSSCNKDDEEELGTIVITNTTNYSYKSTFDGSITDIIPAHYSLTISNVSVGIHSVFVEQLNGYSKTPDKQTFAPKVEKDKTNSIVIK